VQTIRGDHKIAGTYTISEFYYIFAIADFNTLRKNTDYRRDEASQLDAHLTSDLLSQSSIKQDR
jgi:hypothetical protein